MIRPLSAFALGSLLGCAAIAPALDALPVLVLALTSCLCPASVPPVPAGHCASDSECPGNDPPPGDCIRWRCGPGTGDTGNGCARIPLAAGSACTNGRPECTGACDGSTEDHCALTPPLPTTCAP